MAQRRIAPKAPRSRSTTDCSDAEWEQRVDLACAYRLLAHLGWHSLVYNHLTARVPGPDDHFLINPFGLMFHEVTASNLIKIDTDGNKLSDSPHPVLRAGFIVHRSVHMSRPDIGAVMHNHTIAGVAVSCQADGLLPINLGSMGLSNSIAYHDVEGISLERDESDRIAADLGDRQVMILRNHGLLVCGRTVAEAFALLFSLERCCQIQIAAQSGGARLIQPPAAVVERTAQQYTRRLRQNDASNDGGHAIQWAAMRRWMQQESPGFDR